MPTRSAPAAAKSRDPFAALADPTRRRLLDLLSEGDKPVHVLAGEFEMTRPAVSQHLRVLRDAGLVREHVVGRERYYHLLADGLREAAEWIGRYERFWATHLDQLHTYLDREAEDNR